MLAWIEEAAPYGVITTDRDFRIRSWNRWMELHAGKPFAAVAGQGLFALFPELAARGLAGRLLRVLEGEASVLSTALHGYLITLPLASGECGFNQMQQTARIAPLLYKGEIVGSIIVIEDVSQREIQALTLRRQHQRDNIMSWALAQLLASKEPRHSIRDLFCKIAGEFDFDSYLLYLRPRGQQNLTLTGAGGMSPEEETQFASLEPESELGRLFLTVDRPRASENLPLAQTKEAVLNRVFGFRSCALLPLLADGARLGMLCFASRSRETLQKDEVELLSTISQYLAVAVAKEATHLELHAAQAQLSRHAQELEHKVDDRTAKLRETISELETFSHTVAHDLRAPIRALTGYCQTLAEDFSTVLPPDAKDVIDRLGRACERLDLLTRDLLEFTRVSRQEIHLAPVDLEAVVADALFLHATQTDVIQVRRPLLPVLAHRTLLQQCLGNLIDNALKFVPPGSRASVTVWTEITPVGKVRIVVEDKGIGIAEEVKSKIFGIFERGTSSSTYPGSGIGLAIVDRALQRMGGACGVESELGVGSRFWLEVPAAPPEAQG